MKKKYKCSMAGKGYCQYEFASGFCDNKDSCTNKIEVSEIALIQKYKSKLLTHLLWETDEQKCLSSKEKMLFDAHLLCLKEIIKDLEEIK